MNYPNTSLNNACFIASHSAITAFCFSSTVFNFGSILCIENKLIIHYMGV